MALDFKPRFGVGSAAKSVTLPESKPGALGELLIVPPIRRRNVACGEWPDIRRFEHFLYLLDVTNDALDVHVSQSSRKKGGAVNNEAATSLKNVAL